MALRDLFIRIKGDKSQLDSTLKGGESSLNKFGNTVKKIGGILLAAFSVTALISFGKELLELANKAEGIKTAFKNLNQKTLLADLQKATRGTVDDVKLMQKAIQAKNFKIPLEQLATYFEFATKRAIQTGESVDYLVDSIITGIGRKSVLVMDNLGISAVELQKEVAKVGDFGKASGNIIRRELTSMGDVADTTSIKIAALGTEWTNLKTSWGTVVAESDWFVSIIKSLDSLARKFQDPNLNIWQAIFLPGKAYDEGLKRIEDTKKKLGFGTLLSDMGGGFPSFKGKNTIIIDPEQAKLEADALEALKKSMEVFYAKAKQLQGLPQNNVTSSVFGQKTYGTSSPLSNKLAGGPTQYAGTSAVAMQMANDLQAALTEGAVMDAAETFADDWQKTWESAIGAVTDLLSESFISVFESIGEGNFEGLGKNMLGSMGRLVADLGKMLVALGTTWMTALTLIKAPTIASAAAAIAIGGVAMAIGGAMVGASKKASGSMQSSGGYSGGASGGLQSQKIVIEGKLSGRNIYWSNRRYESEMKSGT